MTISTQAVTATKSGSSFTIDVTNANLSEDLTEKDFIVINKSANVVLDNANFTKTNQTTLSYSGTALASGTELEVRRDTPVERYQDVTFSNRFDSSVYNTEIDDILKKLFELDLFTPQDGAVAGFADKNKVIVATMTSSQAATGSGTFDKLELERRLDPNEQWNDTTNQGSIGSEGYYLISWRVEVSSDLTLSEVKVDFGDGEIELHRGVDPSGVTIISGSTASLFVVGQLANLRVALTGSGSLFIDSAELAITPLS